MKRTALMGAVMVVLAAFFPGAGLAFELEQGLYAAGIIKYPTALNQPTTHTFHGSLEIADLGEPDLNPYNFRYGLQLGAFQLLTDLHYALEPKKEFDFGEVRGKLQVISLDEFRFSMAFGFLGRFVQDSDERLQRIEDKTTSLLGIASIELFPFQQWGGILFNFYLDNRVFVAGLKAQLYQSIQLVVEGDYKHATISDQEAAEATRNNPGAAAAIQDATQRENHYTAGVSFEGDQNLYFQLLYTDQGERVLIQIGTGF